jgi:hypothetical protein
MEFAPPDQQYLRYGDDNPREQRAKEEVKRPHIGEFESTERSAVRFSRKVLRDAANLHKQGEHNQSRGLIVEERQ